MAQTPRGTFYAIRRPFKDSPQVNGLDPVFATEEHGKSS